MNDVDIVTAIERILAMRAADPSIVRKSEGRRTSPVSYRGPDYSVFRQGVKRITEQVKRDFPAVTTKLVRTTLKQGSGQPLDEGVELHSGSESDDSLLDHPTIAYRILAVPGKGMGMFAARDVQPGELVLREAPLMVMTWDEEEDDKHAARVNALSESSRTTFFSLHDKDASTEPTAKGIWEVRKRMRYKSAVLVPPLTTTPRPTPCSLA